MSRLVSVALTTLVVLTSHALADSGWTHFEPVDGQKIVYVSDTSGQDPGEVYIWDESDPPEDIGEDPFLPDDIDAFKTLAAAYGALDGGEPGWMLLKRGDSWGAFPNLTKSGPTSGPGWLLIGAYGALTENRPSVESFFMPCSASVCPGIDPISRMAIVSLEVRGEHDGPFWFVRPVADLLFEDVLIPPGDDHGIALQVLEEAGSRSANVRIRRCVIFGRGQTGSSGGIWVKQVDGLLIEESVFWHNGWIDVSCPWPQNFDCPSQSGVSGGRHNMYLTCGNMNIIVRNNISADASYAGCQQRSDGINENNLYLRNGVGIQIGFTNDACDWDEGDFGSALARNNVVIDAGQSGTAGHGLYAANTKGATFERNLVAHKVSGTNGGGIMITRNVTESDGFEPTVFKNNVIYDWDEATGNIRARSVQIDCNDPTVEPICEIRERDVLLLDNVLQQPNGGLLVWHFPYAPGGHVFKNTLYYSPDSEPFLIEAGSCCGSHDSEDWDFWTNFMGGDEINGDFLDDPIEFPAPERNIDSYLTSISMSPGSDAITTFMLEAIQQSKTNWNPDLTAAAVNCYMRGGFDMDEPCPADIDSLGGSGPDGTVDVFDLLALLGEWGPCADCTPGNCPADLTGSCSVGVFDILALLGAWGLCASCAPDEVEEEVRDCLDRYEPGTTELRDCLEYVRDYGTFFHHYEEY